MPDTIERLADITEDHAYFFTRIQGLAEGVIEEGELVGG